MDRRKFIKILSSAAIASQYFSTYAFAGSEQPEIAVTMDDPHTRDSGPLSNDQLSKSILDVFSRAQLKIALFVNAGRVDSIKGRSLIEKFDAAGHLICNHSYSHFNYHSDQISFQHYSEDFLRCDDYIKSFKNYRRFFRYPMLREGNTLEKRDQMRALLAKHSYRNGYVTIDNSDWFIDLLTRRELDRKPKLDLDLVKKFYLKHMVDQANAYNAMAKNLLNRPVRQTLLTHFNLVSALFLGDLIQELRNSGWKVIDAAQAYDDPVFLAQPDIMPAGDSLIKAMARESSSFESIPDPSGEDEANVERQFRVAINAST